MNGVKSVWTKKLIESIKNNFYRESVTMKTKPEKCNSCKHCTGDNFCKLLKEICPPVGTHQDCPLNKE